MKKILICFLTFCILCSSSGLASGIYNDSFDAVSSGVLSVADWKVIDNDFTGGTVKIVERSGTDMAVRLEKNATANARNIGVEKTFEIQKNDFTFEFEINMSDGEHYIYLLDSSNKYPPAVMLSVKDGMLIAHNGDEKQEFYTEINYGAWKKLNIYLQLEKEIYSVYVGNSLVADKIPMKADKIDCIRFTTAMVNSATVMEFDSVKGYSGLPAGAEIDSEGNLSSELTITEPEEEDLPRVEVYTQDFDALSELNLNEWSVAEGIGKVTVEPEIAGRKKVLKVTKEESETDQMLSVNLTLNEAISDNCTFETWYRHDSASKAGSVVYIFDDAGSNPSGPAMFLSSNIAAFNGDKQDSMKPDIKNDQWFKLAVYIKPEEGKYDIYVNDKVVGEDLKFRNASNKNVKRIMIGTSNTKSACICAYDNIRVYTGKPEIAGNGNSTEASAGAGKKTTLPAIKDYSSKTTPRLKNAIVMMVDKYSAFVNNHATVIDSKNLRVKPVVVNDRTLVPVRFIAESLGGTVNYEAETEKIEISLNGNTVSMTVNSDVMAVNGKNVTLEVAPSVIHGRTLIPLRAVSESLGKKVFWDDCGLIIISDSESIFNSKTEADAIEYVARQFDSQSEIYSPSPYSDVYLSSRWYRQDGRDGQLGTLDVLKQFMATGDKWSYISEPHEIAPIVNLGTTFQGAINTNMGGDSSKAQLFDGTLAVAPWMSWGATWNCMNNPEYHQILKNAVKKGIDNGVTQFQFDDWAGNVSTLSWGGCFCTHCMTKFTQYLKEKYTVSELAALEIDNIDTFNFKTFMQQKFGANDTTSYLASKSKTKITPIFEEFQLQSTRDVHVMLKEYMNTYAGKPIQYSHNVFNFGSGFNERSRTFCYDVFDGGMGESKADALSLGAMVSSGYLSSGIKRPFIYSPLPEGEGVMDIIRMGIALAYSTGQYMLVPWDTWLHDDVRYFADVEEVGDLYHFIRQYPYLFDNYEVPAKIGVLADLENITAPNLRVRSVELFEKAVPFRDLVSKRDIPSFEITADNLDGLMYILEETPISNLTEKEQELLKNSGIPIISPDNLTDELLSSLSTSSVDGYSEIYTVLREIVNNPEEPKILHVLNRNGHSVKNIEVSVKESDLYYNTDVDVMMYAPGENPIKLETERVNGLLKIKIPSMDIWGVLRIYPKGTQFTENFSFVSGWSGINLGTRPSKTDYAVEIGENSFEMVSKGRGFNLMTADDTTGSQEQMNFVYKNFNVSKFQNYSVEAQIKENTGIAGVMLREYPNSNSRFVSLYQQGGKLYIASRDKSNADVLFSEVGSSEGLAYLKLICSEGKIYAFASADGKEYKDALGEIDIKLMHPLGGVVCASPSGKENKAVVENVKLEKLGMSKSATPSELKLVAGKTRIEIGKFNSVSATCITEGGEVLTSDDFEVSYSSSNPDIAAIDGNGRISAISPGTVTITGSATVAGKTVSSQININVILPMTEIFNDNFDTYNSETLPDGWAFTGGGGGGSYARVVQEPADYDKSISIYDNTTSSDTKGVYTFENIVDNPLVIEFDYMIRYGENKDAGGANILYTYDSTGNYGICLFASPTHFWYIDMGEHKNICPIEENKWYKVKIEAYPKEQKMDFYLDGELIMEGAGFRTPVSDFGSMQIGGNVNAVNSTSFWNNMKIELKK